nr:hypothetical protein [uncultured Ruminococcus sp.]
MTEDNINNLLNKFSCSQDLDIENFLKEKAIKFERLLKARTYLILNEEELIDSNDISNVNIYGYFSIALKVLTIPEECSNSKRKQLDGLSAKIHGKAITSIPCYLIGQLARNSNVPRNILSGEKILEYAYSIILSSSELVGGRIIMVECHDCEKLISFYKENNFSIIAEMPDNDVPMKQLIRRIK